MDPKWPLGKWKQMETKTKTCGLPQLFAFEPRPFSAFPIKFDVLTCTWWVHSTMELLASSGLRNIFNRPGPCKADTRTRSSNFEVQKQHRMVQTQAQMGSNGVEWDRMGSNGVKCGSNAGQIRAMASNGVKPSSTELKAQMGFNGCGSKSGTNMAPKGKWKQRLPA